MPASTYVQSVVYLQGGSAEGHCPTDPCRAVASRLPVASRFPAADIEGLAPTDIHSPVVHSAIIFSSPE